MALVLACAMAAAAAYLQALDYPFISDDTIYLTNNPKLSGLHLTELWRLFTEPYNGFSEFLPLRDLSYWLDLKLFGLNPAAFRAHNILLYLFCLPLVYATTSELWRYFRSVDAASAPWVAAVVTALFALHPALIEPVVAVSGRKYVLPNLFSMLALWLAVRARRNHGLSAPHAAAALAAFAAVMLSKASYVAVAPVIAMLWMAFWLDIPAPDRRRSLLLWPLAILLLAGLMLRIFVATSIGKEQGYFGIEMATRTLAVLGWLTRLAFSPEGRHSFYPVFEDPHFTAMAALGVASLAATVTGGVMFLRKRSLVWFALAAFLLLCVPYLQLIPYGSPTLVADRYLAIAAWPAVLLLVALSWRLQPAPRIALLLAIALPWGFQTMEKPRDWRSLEAVIDADLRAFPGHYMSAVFKIVAIQLPQGLHRDAMDTANSITTPEFRDIAVKLVEADHAVSVDAVATGNPNEAMALLEKLRLALKQPIAQARWNSPIVLSMELCKDNFVYEWNSLVKHFPDNASVRYNAGLSLINFNFYADAAMHLRAATGSQHLPETLRGTAFYNLGLALLLSGHVAEAEVPLRAALEQQTPDLWAYCLLSRVYKQAKRFEETARAEASCPGRTPNEKTAQ